MLTLLQIEIHFPFAFHDHWEVDIDPPCPQVPPIIVCLERFQRLHTAVALGPAHICQKTCGVHHNSYPAPEAQFLSSNEAPVNAFDEGSEASLEDHIIEKSGLNTTGTNNVIAKRLAYSYLLDRAPHR